MWTVEFACLPSCSFAHACEGRSLQAGTPELAYATVARPCGIGCRSGLPWGVFTTTGPLGAAQAGLPWVYGGSVHVPDMLPLVPGRDRTSLWRERLVPVSNEESLWDWSPVEDRFP
uniref:Uncharacterized protein n=1 Tax=Ananas comosus var. bracteatus TaxID=296719 RepID=A0A6V7NEZ1_ANACO|nr:unnamed protein product [Ananas comosus var. bracteatus]